MKSAMLEKFVYDSSILNSSSGSAIASASQAEAEAEKPVFTCQSARACVPSGSSSGCGPEYQINQLPPPSFDVTPPTSLTGNSSLSYAPDTVLLRAGLLVESLYIAMPHPL